MKSQIPVAVTSRSFSKHPVLRAEILSRYERVTFNEDGKSLSGNELVAFLKGHGKAILSLERVDDELLSQILELKVIGKFGVGIDSFDLSAMERHGVSLGWQGGTNKTSVAELALCFMLALLHRVPLCRDELKTGIWKQQKGSCLTGCTVGLIGCGNVGQELARLLKPFQCRLLAFDTMEWAGFYAENLVTPVSLGNLLGESDIVSLHVPFNAGTRNLLNESRLGMMKPSAYLINTSRGGLVDERALKQALMNSRLAGAGFDVFANEPPDDPELFTLPHFLGTPHIGGSTEEAIVAMGMAAIEGLETAKPASVYSK